MTKAQDLKSFCDSFNFEFPDFILKKDVNGVYICNVVWYGENILMCNQFSNENDTILSCLLCISEWLECDKNFIYLAMLDKHCSKSMKK